MNFRCSLWILVGLIISPGVLPGQSATEDFEKSCAVCHSIGGGPLAGPDLAGVVERRERSWLIRFIVDPQSVIDSGDAAAREMVDQYKGMVMPALPGMTSGRAAALVDYIAKESAAAASPTAAAPPPQAAFTVADVNFGRRLFRGEQALEAGGAACLACHDVAASGWLGGGSLGPNLSDIYSRLGGRQGLEPWLSAPPTPTMSSQYRTHPLSGEEIHALTAYFEERTSDEGVAASGGRGVFLLLGSGATLLLLFVFHLLWRERFRGVRRSLVEDYRMRGVQ